MTAVQDLTDEGARLSIRQDTDRTLFVEAGAGAGKTTALVGRILSLVDEGVDIGAIAAITFTEKAAAELRQRLRAELGGAPTALRTAALDALDHAPIGTLHAFARRLLFELPVEAGLPPGFTVLDDLESQLALDERWDDLLDEILDDADHEVVPGLSAAELVQLVQWGSFGGSRGLRRVSEDFQANWDLVEHRVSFDPPARPGPPTAALQRIAALVATPVPPDDKQADVLAAVAAGLARVDGADDIATLLGFSDSPAFRKALKRWTGQGLTALRGRPR
jgi:ATP-dependent helicase/nuclease subunit A